jgi:hypothetical protein
VNDQDERAGQPDPFADLPLLGELRDRLQARFRVAEHLPAARFARVAEHAGGSEGRRARWVRHGRRSRLLLALGALLLAGGTATAAVTLSGTQSAPLSGSVPGRPVESGHEFNFTEAGKQYRIVFVPQLSGGEAGWRSFLSFGPGANPEAAKAAKAGTRRPARRSPAAPGSASPRTRCRVGTRSTTCSPHRASPPCASGAARSRRAATRRCQGKIARPCSS